MHASPEHTLFLTELYSLYESGSRSSSRYSYGYGAVKDTLDDDPRNGWSSHDSDITQTRIAVFELAEPLGGGLRGFGPVDGFLSSRARAWRSFQPQKDRQ